MEGEASLSLYTIANVGEAEHKVTRGKGTCYLFLFITHIHSFVMFLVGHS